MRIIVDGDACPGISIIKNVAKKYNLPLIVYCDINHYIQLDYGEVKVVDCGFQSVDMYVVNTCKSNDVVISQDYGVAALCLGKGAHLLNPKGFLYTEENIDRMLEQRHISQKIRRAGGRTSNPKKRTREDDLRLEKNLINIIECNLKR
jgi:uncharacterized protein YaiI (UPF0178 family)